MTSTSLRQTLSSGGRFAAHSERGPRIWNADHLAIAEHHLTSAITICDGAGDDIEAASCARMAAETAAAAAAHTGMAMAGVGAARQAVEIYYQATPPGQDATATIITAVLTNFSLNLAWAGDSQAFALTRDGMLHPLTKPYHPLRPEPRNVAAGPIHHRHIWLEHPGGDGPAEVLEISRLLLCSDGLTEKVTHTHIAEVLRGGAPMPAAICTELVDLAYTAGTHDNVTVAVIDLPDRTDPGSGAALQVVGAPLLPPRPPGAAVLTLTDAPTGARRRRRDRSTRRLSPRPVRVCAA
ncbi:PP2C family protein-serine/threonine phosphatase [Streptosporangium canum]|uniref:PP2C family protein-serine/threonine phosphatase n=1 Tax=Streptosporangium canum TaxID=324952 RepID=UPI0036CF9A40